MENEIIKLMKNDTRRDYTIPEIMRELKLGREKVVMSLARLEGKGKVEISRVKGKTTYYRLYEKQVD